MNKLERNIGLDLFRIIMMFGICLIHTCGQGKYKCTTLHNMMLPSVVGFAMLSGFFGIRFAPSKLVRLYSLAIGYCLFIPIIGNAYQGGGGYVHSVVMTWGAPWRYWYLHAYAALMCLAPALKAERFGRFQPFFLIVFLWGFLLVYRTFSDYIPHASGFGSYSFVTLLGIYLFARVAKELGWFDKVPFLWVFGLMFSSVIILAFVPATGMYNSPVALALAFSVFSVFSRIKSLGWANNVVKFVAPSMFGVYLLHCAIIFPGVSTDCYGLINYLEDFHVVRGMPIFAAYLMVAFEVFSISLVIDLIRRILMNPVKNKLKILFEKMDGAYEKLSI